MESEKIKADVLNIKIFNMEMEKEILEKIEENKKRLEEIYASTEKTQKYFLWALIFNVVVIVLPFLGLLLIIPWFLKTISLEGLGL